MERRIVTLRKMMARNPGASDKTVSEEMPQFFAGSSTKLRFH